jgi:CoA-transferase family III
LTIVNVDFTGACNEDQTVSFQSFIDTFGVGPEVESGQVQLVGGESFPSVYDVTGFATAAMTSVAIATARLSALLGGVGGTSGSTTVDQRLTSLWMTSSIAPQGWELPSPWDDIAGDYRTRDGWIRLHTNAKAHRAAALAVLGCAPTKDAIAAVLAESSGDELETAIHQGGGVAGNMRSAAEWSSHPHGHAVAREPLVHSMVTQSIPLVRRTGTPQRPLAGVRVLDLTKVLAGPVATRTLAMLGADVIRVDASAWAEPSVSQDTTVGKRCVHIDARTRVGQSQLQQLFRSADIFVHGYRPGTLDRLGLAADRRVELNPGIVEVSLNAYGHSGPWKHRRGFDSVVQMSCGIAATGMSQLEKDRPTPLPVQALDHVTGYLMAATAINAWIQKYETGCGSSHRTSLARTAVALMAGPAGDLAAEIHPARLDAIDGPSDYGPNTELTSWGPARRLIPPFVVPGVELRWDRPASELGSHGVPIDWLK